MIAVSFMYHLILIFDIRYIVTEFCQPTEIIEM